MNCQHNPIIEVFYNTHTAGRTRLYDCLIPVITDLQKPSEGDPKKIVIYDEWSDSDEIDVKDLEDVSDSDNVNYRRALVKQHKKIIRLKGQIKELKS